MEKLKDFCFYSPPILAVLNIILSVIFFVPITEFKEWLPVWSRSNMGGWTFLIIITYNVFLSLMSFLILLNLLRFVRKNKILSFLTFFTPAILYYILILGNINHPDAGFSLLIPIMYLILQTGSFIYFQKKLKSGVFDG